MNRLRLRTGQDFLKAWVVSKRVPFPACSHVGKGDAVIDVIDAPQKKWLSKRGEWLNNFEKGCGSHDCEIFGH
jgi:hypothetical protein